MPHRRIRINWQYDNELQQFTTPTGRVVTLREIAQLLQDQVNCRHDFAGPWTGWKMRGPALIPPGGKRGGPNITAFNAMAFRRWLASFEAEQAQLDFDKPVINEAEAAYGPRKPPAGRPHLRLVHTSSR